MNLFVSNLDRSVNEDALKALFSEFGPVISAKIITDRESGMSKGFGFVDMSNDSEAMTAIEKLSNVEFFGRRLSVSKARPRSNN
jgi:RNA recognition motif-containing protein